MSPNPRIRPPSSTILRPGTLQLAGAAAAVAVRAPAVVPGQVSVLRLQFARRWRRLASGLPEARYLEALRADLEAALPLVWGRPIVSVFIGGGTPSLFSPEGIDAPAVDVRSLLPLEPGCEITLEANPGTFERERFRAFAQAGVTRLSIGVQSFDDDAAARASAACTTRSQARAAVQEARESFERFNLDLMYALPGQTPAAAAARTSTPRWRSSRRTCRSTT